MASTDPVPRSSRQRLHLVSLGVDDVGRVRPFGEAIESTAEGSSDVSDRDGHRSEIDRGPTWRFDRDHHLALGGPA